MTPPAEVSELSGEAGNGKVTLRWTDPTDADFAKVSITYSPGGTTAIEIGKGRQEAVIAGLKNGSEYVFTLKTADVAGYMSAGIGSDGFTQAHEHQVTLSSYWIGETEVTIALWNAVMGSGGGSNMTPVASITRNQSVEFARRLNDIAHNQGLIPDDMNFQIPTEAQWEFAAKGGNKSRGYTYSGSNTLSQVGWTSNDGGIHTVKQKQPNELGIYDMRGNVYERVYRRPYRAILPAVKSSSEAVVSIITMPIVLLRPTDISIPLPTIPSGRESAYVE